MRAPTHTAYSAMFLAIFGTIIHQIIPLWLFAYAGIISLLPDIDSPKSIFGTLFPRTSRLVERKFGGHRTFTHTLNALFLFALITLPIAFFETLIYAAGVVAYFSHIFADSMTKSGNPIIWKNNHHAVFPKSGNLRVAVGSKAEKNLCICLFLISIPIIFLNQKGLLPFMHESFGNMSSAVKEFQQHENKVRSFVKIEGKWVLSQKPISATLEAIGQVSDPFPRVILSEAKDLIGGKIMERVLKIAILIVILAILISAYQQNGCQLPINQVLPKADPEVALVHVTRAIDGDTIELANGQKVRYIGIDTPELHHPKKPVQFYAKEAWEANRRLVEGKQVRLEFDIQQKDKYGRLLAYVYVGNIFVNSWLVENGFAQVATFPPNVRYQSLFLELQRHVRQAKRGLWQE